jgi:pilus assembly protein CpaE
VIITACPELANLRNAKNLIDALAELRPNDGKPKLVMNQVGIPKRPEISVSDFVAPLGVEPAAIIPFDPAQFGTAANNGQMIAEADPKSPLAGSFDLLAQIITGRAEIKVEKKKSPFEIFSRLRPKKG